MTWHTYTAQNVLITYSLNLHYQEWRWRRITINSINTFVSDHKGFYLQLLVGDLSDSKHMDRSDESYWRLRLGQRNIVEKYKTRLKKLYAEHNFLKRAQELTTKLTQSMHNDELTWLFQKIDKMDTERVSYMTAAEKYAGHPQPGGI